VDWTLYLLSPEQFVSYVIRVLLDHNIPHYVPARSRSIVKLCIHTTIYFYIYILFKHMNALR
jgi:hypothetical protein